MSRTSRTSRLAVLLGAFVLAAGTAACSNNADATATATKASVDKGTIRIAYQAFPSGDLVVKDQKWLEKALPAYKIEWKQFDSGASINTAFVAGAIDVAAIGSSPVARGLSAPLNIPYKVAWILDVAGDNEALVARNGGGISSVKDLVGKKVATSFSSTAHYSLLAALAREGVDPTSLKLIDLEPQDILAAWTRGDIDAAYTWLPTLGELKKTGKVLVSSRELATAGKPTLDLGVVSTAFATAHPDAVNAWRVAEARALDLLAQDRPAAAAAVGRQLSISTAEATDQLSQGVYLAPKDLTTQEWLGTAAAPGQLAQNLHSAAEFLAAQKQIPAAPDVKTFEAGLYLDGLDDVVNR
jgi:taurine transport system substrate-binding protein